MRKPDIDRITQFGGQNTFYDLEKMPSTMQSKLVNMTVSDRLGILKSRPALFETAGAGALFKFIKHDDTSHYYVKNTASGIEMKRAVRIGYGSPTWGNAVTLNDYRTNAVNNLMTFPVNYREEARSAMITIPTGALTYPAWVGYMAQRYRFNSAINIAAGWYAADQFQQGKWSTFGANSMFSGATTSYGSSFVDGIGGRPGFYYFFLAPVIDGYQRGIPEINSSLVTRVYTGLTGRYAPHVIFNATTASFKLPRITDFDVFISYSPERSFSDYAKGGVDVEVFSLPAYFLERISLNDHAPNYFLTIDDSNAKGAVAAPAPNQISITNASTWLTFDPRKIIIDDSTNGRQYVCASYSVVGDVLTMTLDTTRYDNTTSGTYPATLNFRTGWTYDGTNRQRKVFWDNKYMLRGTEMFTYLNLPPGEQGLSNHTHEFGDISSQRYWMLGPTIDKTKIYVSKYGEPDVMLSLSEINVNEEPTAIAEYGEDTLVFFKNYFKTFRNNPDGSIQELNTDHRCGASWRFAVSKAGKYEIYGVDRKGPWMYNNGNVIRIGLVIDDMFGGVSQTNLRSFTEQDIDGCYVKYFPGDNQVWFNFPDYEDTSEGNVFLNGITLVYDRFLAEDVSKNISPWYIFGFTGLGMQNMEPNYWGELMLSDSVSLYAYHLKTTPTSANDESVTAIAEFKGHRNMNPEDWKLFLSKIGIQYKSDQEVEVGLFIDEAASPTAITTDAATDFPNSDIVVKRLADQFRLRIKSIIEHDNNDDDFEIKQLRISGKSKTRG